MSLLMVVLAVWFGLSIPVGLLLGRMMARLPVPPAADEPIVVVVEKKGRASDDLARQHAEAR